MVASDKEARRAGIAAEGTKWSLKDYLIIWRPPGKASSTLDADF